MANLLFHHLVRVRGVGLLRLLLSLLAQHVVVPVFDLYATPAGHVLGDQGPLVPERGMQAHQLHVFFSCPFFVIDVWIEDAVEAIAAVLDGAMGQHLSHLSPRLSIFDCINEHHVLLLGPLYAPDLS